MRYYGSISDNNDLVTKEYADTGVNSRCILITTESNNANATVSTTDTYGVAPYNTNYYYTNITVDTNKVQISESDLFQGLRIYIQLSNSVSASYKNVRIRFGSNGNYYPLYSSDSILSGDEYLLSHNIRAFVYSTGINTSGAFHILTTNDIAFCNMSYVSSVYQGSITYQQILNALTNNLMVVVIDTTDSNNKYLAPITSTDTESSSITFSTVIEATLYYWKVDSSNSWTVGTSSLVDATLRSQVTQNTSNISALTSNLSATSLQVTSNTNSISSLSTSVSNLTTTVASKLDSTQVASQIEARLQQGVPKVVTSNGYTMNDNGISIGNVHISSSDGLEVLNEDNETVVKATADGLETTNITINKSMMIGTNSRMEDYLTNRTACFYVG